MLGVRAALWTCGFAVCFAAARSHLIRVLHVLLGKVAL
jgi:hypothetical protein